MQCGDDAWMTLEASGWRNRALKAEAELAAFAAEQAPPVSEGENVTPLIEQCAQIALGYAFYESSDHPVCRSIAYNIRALATPKQAAPEQGGDVITMPRMAAQALLNDLNARIDKAHSTCVPVFAGIVELHAALSAKTDDAGERDLGRWITDNASDTWEVDGYESAADEVFDMANVGRSFMERYYDAVKPGAQFAGWAPADDPAEFVTFLCDTLHDALPSTTMRDDGGEVGNPYVPGPVWYVEENECWTSEVQIVGGHYTVATVHGATELEAVSRRDAVIAALRPSDTKDGGGA